MSAPAFDPEWGDDLMAMVDATREPALPHPDFAVSHIPHPSIGREVFTDLALELVVREWAADVPIALTPTEHVECSACAKTLCMCDVPCDEFPLDVCSHYGYPHCASCGPLNCADCGDEQRRWG